VEWAVWVVWAAAWAAAWVVAWVVWAAVCSPALWQPIADKALGMRSSLLCGMDAAPIKVPFLFYS